MVKVSVVIVCHNLGRYLAQCVQSVTGQEINDPDDYEIIIVDDASDDETQEICAKVESQGLVRVHRNSTNLHVSRSRNIGISMASGKYIIPLDADDMLRPDALRVLSSALDNDRLLDIAYGSMDVLEEDGRMWRSGWPPKDFSYEGQMTGKNQLPYASMYRRIVWERVGGYRPGYESVEDALFWTQATALSFKPQKVTEAATLLYRMRSDSLSHTTKVERPWWQLAPRKAQWTPFTYEPIKISVVVTIPPGSEEVALHTIDCVWSQTFHAWECIALVDSYSKVPYPPFVRIKHFDYSKDDILNPLDIAEEISKGETMLAVGAGMHLDNSFLEKTYKLWTERQEHICPAFFVKDSEPELTLCEAEDSMACGTCGKKFGNTSIAPVSFANRNMGVEEIPGTEEGKMLVEFIGEGGWTIRGPVTGTMYYFDVMSGHRVKSLWATDAKALLATYDTLVKEYSDAGVPA